MKQTNYAQINFLKQKGNDLKFEWSFYIPNCLK